MKWQAINFFKSPGGLSRNEPVEIRACLDYEQALECKKRVELVSLLSLPEKEWMLTRALRWPSRFASIRFHSESRLFRTWKDASSFPPIPAVCIAASWFPKHWLEAPASARRKVVNEVKTPTMPCRDTVMRWLRRDRLRQELLRQAVLSSKYTS